MNSIEAKDTEVLAALRQLQERIEHPRPFLAALSEDMMERTKQRFITTTAPDGSRWTPNAEITLIRYIQSRGGFSKKTGKITAGGRASAMGKRPLHGESGDLAREFLYDATDDSMTMGSIMRKAAMLQFGGTRSEFPHLWGDIPGRAFMPVTSSGDLYPSEQNWVMEELQAYLSGI